MKQSFININWGCCRLLGTEYIQVMRRCRPVALVFIPCILSNISVAFTWGRAITHLLHYSDAIVSAMVSQITCVSIVYSTVCSDADQRKYQFRVTGLYEGNSPVTNEFPAQRARNAENVSIWWRHHGSWLGVICEIQNFHDSGMTKPCGFVVSFSFRMSTPWHAS